MALDLTPYVVCSFAILYVFRPSTETLWISLDWVLILLSGGCLWVISFASDTWKLRWRTREYGVAAGFLWSCSLRFIVIGLRIVMPASETPSLYGLDICITIVAILIWLKYFLKKEPELLNLSLQQLREINGLLVSFEKSVATEKPLTLDQSRS